MQRLFLILRDVVWSAVIAVALAAVSVLSALVDPSNVAFACQPRLVGSCISLSRSKSIVL